MSDYISRKDMNDMLDELCVNDSLYNALQTIPVIEIEPDKSDYIIKQSQIIKNFAEKLKTNIKKLKASSQNIIYQNAMQDMLDDIFPKIIDDAVSDTVKILTELKGE